MVSWSEARAFAAKLSLSREHCVRRPSPPPLKKAVTLLSQLLSSFPSVATNTSHPGAFPTAICLTDPEKRCLRCVGHAVAWCRGAEGSSRWPGMLGHKWAVGPARPQRRPEPGHWGLGIEKPRSGETKNPNKEQTIQRHRIYPDWNGKKSLSLETGKVESSIEKLKIEKKKNWFSTNLRSEPQKWGQVKEEVVEATRTLRRSSRRRSARRWPTWRSSWYSRCVAKYILNREFFNGEAGGGVIRNVK